MDLPAVEQYLKGLQASICQEMSAIDGSAEFATESWSGPKVAAVLAAYCQTVKSLKRAGLIFPTLKAAKCRVV